MRISDWSSDVCSSDLHVRPDRSLRHPFHDRGRPEDGGAFLVAGDDEAERARMMGNLGTGGDEGGDGALHVDGAAPIEEIAAYLGREGVGRPAVTGGDHIDMAGEGEMR